MLPSTGVSLTFLLLLERFQEVSSWIFVFEDSQSEVYFPMTTPTLRYGFFWHYLRTRCWHLGAVCCFLDLCCLFILLFHYLEPAAALGNKLQLLLLTHEMSWQFMVGNGLSMKLVDFREYWKSTLKKSTDNHIWMVTSFEIEVHSQKSPRQRAWLARDPWTPQKVYHWQCLAKDSLHSNILCQHGAVCESKANLQCETRDKWSFHYHTTESQWILLHRWA